VAVIAPLPATAVSGAGQVPRMRDFVRLKLRIMRNVMRGSGQRIALFVAAILGGLWAAMTGFGFFAVGGSSADPDIRTLVAAFGGAVLVLAWLLLPLLFFGVDETVDPARFALLPLRRRTLATGMLAAACVGIPPLVTLLASTGLLVGAAVRGGWAAALFTPVALVVGLLLCVVASRAVTSAFATMLRSRKVRDLAVIVIAVLASSIGPAQLLISSLVEGGSLTAAGRFARVLGWTPLGAPYAAVADAIDGRWAYACGKLAIAVLSIGLLLWWWSFTIESAMVGASSTSGSADAGVAAPGASAVAGLVPRALRGLPASPALAIMSREWRYWWREPRRRAGLVSLVMASVVVPFTTRLAISGDATGGLPLPLSLSFAGLLVGMAQANQFGADGTAYGAHLLAGVPGRIDLRARGATLALLGLPTLLVVAVVLAVVTNGLGQLTPGIGALVAAFGVSLSVAALVSVLAPYPMPESTNAFAVNSGGSATKGLLAFAGLFVTMGLVSPVLIMYGYLPDDLTWLILPIGVVWGVGALLLATYIAGDILDRRGPAVLLAVAPRR
jgi:ABC-2 type transport system permease protein